MQKLFFLSIISLILLSYLTSARPLVIAHRGESSIFPENTL